MGYNEIGMDHFALPDDPLFIAKRQQELHRNFMGYTTSPSKMLIGLGNSSISDIGTAYAQNQKDIDDYKAQIESKQFAINKGHVLTQEDVVHKRLIMDIICHGKVEWDLDFYSKLPAAALVQLDEMVQDGLLKYSPSGIWVCTTGKAILRNICAVFDRRMQRQSEGDFVFSKAV
jgi:oxygen-independent coproporphyrinogen-3 oxidase